MKKSLIFKLLVVAITICSFLCLFTACAGGGFSAEVSESEKFSASMSA